MEPTKGEVSPVNQKESVLEQVVRERSIEINTFENMITHEEEFNMALITLPDDFIIRLYDYLAQQEKQLSFLTQTNKFDERKNRLKKMLLKLEDIPVIQEHMVSKALTPEEVAQINETVSLVREKQKYRKMGPVRKLIYDYKKNRKNK